MNRADREVKTIILLEVTTFGHESHRAKSLHRMLKELKLQGFKVRPISVVPALVDPSGEGHAV